MTVSTDRSAGRPAMRFALAALLLPLLAGVLGIVRHLPPPPLPADAPADRFSATRAMTDVEAIARAPHPMGSAEHRRVREYIVERLRALGLQPEVQQALGVNRPGNAVAPVANVVARRAGTRAGGRAILLVAHYDSVPTGPGASDDGAGVAALLEAARWLGATPPLANDVILLFTDGEEFGLFGAQAFVDGHRWARDVGLVVNLEARGHTGPSMLFETSAGNAALIAGASRGVPGAVANSLTYEVYKRLPNDTDFTVFRRAGFAGVNMAYLGGVTHYHDALDAPANVDRASLQHHGEYLTGLLRAFGDAELPLRADTDAIYFPAPGAGLIRYAPALAVPLAVGVWLLVGLLAWQARRRGELGGRAVLRGLLRVVGTLGLAAFIGWGAWALLQRLNPSWRWLANGDGYNTDLLFVGLVAICAGASIRLSAKERAGHIVGWGVWAVFGLVTAVQMPGASWLFAWPLAAGAIGELFAVRSRATTGMVWRAAGLMPLAFLAAPVAWLLFASLGPSNLAAILFFATLCMLPLLPLTAHLHPGRLSAALCGAGVCLGVAAVALSGFSPETPKPNQIVYLLERDATAATPVRARWFTPDAAADAWTSQFLGADPASAPLPEIGRSAPVLAAPAPVLALPAAELRTTGDRSADGMRRIDLLLVSKADVVALQPAMPSAVRSVQVGGATLFDAQSVQPFRRVQIVAPPGEGIEVRFEFASETPLRMQVVQQFRGLPAATEFPHRPRDAAMMTAPSRQADSRITLDRWDAGAPPSP